MSLLLKPIQNRTYINSFILLLRGLLVGIHISNVFISSTARNVFLVPKNTFNSKTLAHFRAIVGLYSEDNLHVKTMICVQRNCAYN